MRHAFYCVTVFAMSSALKAKIKQRTDFANPVGESLLNLLVAADVVRGKLDSFFAGYEITSGQYNVLRILKGAGDEGHPRGEIADRMLERAPDITRLVDRLEKQMFVSRGRSGEDRRHSVTRITNKGLDLLNLIEPELHAFGNQIVQRLSLAEMIALMSICEKIHSEQNESG